MMKTLFVLPASLSLALGLAASQAAAADFTKLYAFTGPPDGNLPMGISVDANGNVYGATRAGGDVSVGACAADNYANKVDGLPYPGCGVVFEIAAGANPKETVLYRFNGGPDGGFPSGFVAFSGTSLFGGTEYGGYVNTTTCRAGCGTVYEFDVSTMNITPVHKFTGGADGGDIYTGVILASNGVLYGTGEGDDGGDGPYTVYSVTPPASGKTQWTLANLLIASQGPIYEPIKMDGAGNLYGVWRNESHGVATCGIYELAKGATGFTYVPLYNFPRSSCGSSGLDHIGIVPFSQKGGAVVLYGVTPDGGAHSAGSIFSLDVATRTFMPLYSFIGGADGVLPMAAIAVDSAGELYGVAFSGGDTTACPAFGRSIPAGCGTVYAFNPTTKAFKPLHTFDGADGARPYELIYAASQSAVYGVTLAGGNLEHCAITDFPLAGCGTVFKIGELP